MFKHYIGIASCGVFVMIAIIIGFTVVGSPVSERAINLDKARLMDFQTIQYKIETYYMTNHKFPDLLSDLDGKPNIKDPETHKVYDFQKGTNGAYKLCTTFSTDSAETNKSGDTQTYAYLGSVTDGKHKKGDDCISYTIPSYYLNDPLKTSTTNYGNMIYPSPSPSPLPVQNTNDVKRRSDVNAILNAISQWTVDNKGVLPSGVASDSAKIMAAPSFSAFCSQLVPSYIAALPVDPTINNGTPIDTAGCSGTSWNTGYSVEQIPGTNKIQVKANRTELGPLIEATR